MKVVNVVATRSLGYPIDLKKLHDLLPNSKFNEKGAKWLMFRFGERDRYFAFYSSGKFLITGANSQKDIEEESDKIIQLLESKGLQLKPGKVIIHNIVVEDDLMQKIILEDVVREMASPKVSYEPEQFPGLIYKNWGVSILLFSGGKFIIAGIKNWDDIDKIIINFKMKFSFSIKDITNPL